MNYKISTSFLIKITFRNFLVLLIILFCNPAFAIPPDADFSANNLTVCINQQTTFTSTSSGSITNYSWSFGSGASPSSANTAGPHNISYSTAGSKTITLTVTGPGGTTTETKSSYVIVGSDRIYIMSYNLLNYPKNNDVANDTTERNPYFRKIISNINPDILVVGELNSQAGLDGFLLNVMNASSNTYSKGDFINGEDTDNGILYKTAKFNFISNTRIKTELRDINEFKLVHLITGDTLRIYALHLKASTGSTNEAQRAREVDSLRKITNTLSSGSDFIVCGDFNFYRSGESAYQKLLQNTAGDEGHFIDPVSISGTWDNIAYSQYHTQSTRVTQLSDGAGGGLNDRFDLMLFSNAVNQPGGISYVTGSLTAYGNDGNHYNGSLNQLPNTAVDSATAVALYYASDHLPIIESFDFQLNNCQSLDLGVTALINPAASVCPSYNKPLQVRIKNFGLNTIDFSSANANIIIQVTNPAAVIKTFSKTISSGTLSANATMDVTFDSTMNMSVPGNYTFNSNTIFSPDNNPANNSMPAVTVTVNQPSASAISPAGPVSICTGSSTILTAASGSDYFWSNGSTTQSITVGAGNYSVSLTDVNGCIFTSSVVIVSETGFQVNNIIFSENVGTAASTISIATHETNNGFENDNLTMTGTGDIRNTTGSANYSGASGGSNVFITNNVGVEFMISGVNTTGLNNLQLSFGLFKSTTVSNGSELLIRVSDDGINYDTLTLSPLPTGTGTATWKYVTVSGNIPSTPNLRIQFRQTAPSPSSQFRLDDIKLSGSIPYPAITAQGPVNFCSGGSVQLNASAAVSYQWSSGQTTQNITATASGNYFVVATSSNGCTAASNQINVTASPCSISVNVKLFLEGFYLGSETLRSVSDLISSQFCDTVILSLASSTSPYNFLYTGTSILSKNGNIQFDFPSSIAGSNYYLVIRHRNSLQTWSSSSLLISGNINYDFTDAANKAFGNNLKNLPDGKFAIYSGDVNQNGFINSDDLNLLSGYPALFTNGYLPEDLTGDHLIESGDYSLIENNLDAFIKKP